jgi:hypothetical protein
MAIFSGAAAQMQHISFALSTSHWPGKEVAVVGRGTMVLAYPDTAPRISGENEITTAGLNKTSIRTRTIVDVFSRVQRGNRRAREKNLGKAPYDGQGVGFDWFERIHVTPSRLDLGNVVSNILKELELFSAYRADNRTWTAFTNNAGAGITILNLPTLPKTIVKLTSFIVSIQISPSGPPTINGTLDFVFDVTTASVPITGTRIILYGFQPTGSVTERLEWLTDIVKAADGTEQRLALRRYPRQKIEFETLLPRDYDRSEFNSFIFDWHSRVFGVPLWWDARKISADVAISDTVVSVTSTDWAEFRVGGLAVLIAYDADGNRTADTLEISSVSSSPAQVTFTSGVANAYTADQAVLVPVVPGVVTNGIPRSRLPAGQQKVHMSFLSVDNAARASEDASAFLSWNGKTVIDDTNFMDKEIREDFRKTITRIDGNTGEILQSSIEDRSTPTSAKRWNVESAQRSWEVRNLLYALHGKQTSFYLPTFGKDLELAAAATTGATTIDVTNIGYTQFIKTRDPYATLIIRFDPNNLPVPPTSPAVYGSPHNWEAGQEYMFLDIIGSTEVSTAVERLSISPSIPMDFTSANILSIQFMIPSRFDSDTVELLHKWTDLLGGEIDSEINATVSGVYDS